MKCLNYLLIVTLVAFISCKKQLNLDTDHATSNTCQSLTEGGRTLYVCLDSVIQDSRCPVNVLCIWQGVAVARFKATLQNENYVLTLATDQLAGYSKQTSIEGFKIEFVKLSPYPDTDKPFNYAEYVAEVKITKL